VEEDYYYVVDDLSRGNRSTLASFESVLFQAESLVGQLEERWWMEDEEEDDWVVEMWRRKGPKAVTREEEEEDDEEDGEKEEENAANAEVERALGGGLKGRGRKRKTKRTSLHDMTKPQENNMIPELKLHVTLIGTTHYLSRLQDIHVVSPSRSLLTRLADVTATWDLYPVSDPFLRSQDPPVLLLCRLYHGVTQLLPALANLEGVVDRSDFFQHSSYQLMVEVLEGLMMYKGEMYEEEAKKALEPWRGPTRRERINRQHKWGTIPRLPVVPIDDADFLLAFEEGCHLLQLACQVVGPAVDPTRRMTAQEYEDATNYLRDAVACLRACCDPDRPLLPSELLHLIEESYSLNPLHG